MYKRRYKLSSRQRTALFGIGQHKKQLNKLFEQKLGEQVKKVDFKNSRIYTNKDVYFIFDEQNELKNFVERDILSNFKNFFEGYQDVYANIDKVGMFYLKKSIGKIVKKVIEEKMIHVQFEKSFMNKIGFGKNQFYLI